jgi:hypothetical protein
MHIRTCFLKISFKIILFPRVRVRKVSYMDPVEGLQIREFHYMGIGSFVEQKSLDNFKIVWGNFLPFQTDPL